MTSFPLADLRDKYGFCDPASGEETVKRVASKSAIVVAAPDHLGRIFVLYSWSARVPADDLMERIYAVQDRFNCRSFGIEKNGLQVLFKGAIQRDVRLHQRRLPLVGIQQPTNRDKIHRIRGYLQPLFGFGRLFLQASMVELEHQIVTFPMNPQRDLIDALATVCNMIPQPKPQRIRDEAREAELSYLRRSGAPLAEIERRAKWTS